MRESEIQYLKKQLTEREAELQACLDGTWPRDTGDIMRWNPPPRPYDPPDVVRSANQDYVANLCRQEIDWLKSRIEPVKF